MKNILDRPAWSALTSRHASLCQGAGPARRYPASIVPFAATQDDSPESLAALFALVPDGDMAVILQSGDVILPEGLNRIFGGDGVQMVAETDMPQITDDRVERLTAKDAADMLALAKLTEPGPFTLRALDLGGFWGIRENGKLVAMAGERMKPVGHTELSGVCTHPDFRGRGLGKLLCRYVAGEISASGNRPFLHARADNSCALALYEAIGFKLRCPIRVVGFSRKGPADAGQHLEGTFPGHG